MIKKQAYIRSFTPAQRQMLEKLSETTGLKNANEIFLHCLEAYYTKQLEVERWKGIAAYKDKKVKKLNEEIESLNLTINVSKH